MPFVKAGQGSYGVVFIAYTGYLDYNYINMSQVGVSEFANQPEVDWPWVKYHLFKKERIAANEAASQKGALLACTEECLKRGESLAAPRLVCAEKKITGFKSGNVEIAGFGALSSSSLASYINGAQDLYFFLVTIGSGIENTATKLMKDGEHLEGYILDRIGSFAVESLAENLEKQVREAYARKAYSASMRLNPRYFDWPT